MDFVIISSVYAKKTILDHYVKCHFVIKIVLIMVFVFNPMFVYVLKNLVVQIVLKKNVNLNV